MTAVPPASWTRRRVSLAAGGVRATLLAVRTGEPAGAKHKTPKPKPGRPALCKAIGSACKKKSATCTASNCLRIGFRAEANWTGANQLYQVYLFAPKRAGRTAVHHRRGRLRMQRRGHAL